jgi:hypothetical protein
MSKQIMVQGDCLDVLRTHTHTHTHTNTRQ